MHIKAGQAITKEKGSLTNAGKCLKLAVPHNKNHTKTSASHSTDTRNLEEGTMPIKHERKHCKWYKQKSRSFWLHNTGDCIFYNAYLMPVCQKGSGEK